ncbi:MAG: WD40 repeat domain-containing protein, partial [Candidatus Rokuibacteriota bacterium]
MEALVTAEKRRALRPRDDLGVEMARQGVDEATLDAVLAQLVDGRLLRVEERGEGAALAYELAHDYLLEEIQLDPAAQARKAAQELLAQKLPYYARDGLLLSADELAIINPQRQWLALSDEAGRLLRESQAAVAQRKRLTMGAIVVAAALILAAILAAVLIQSSAVQEQANLQGTAAAEQAIIASTAVAAQDLAARSEEEAMARLHAVETAQAQTEAEQAVSRSQELAARALLALESESVSEAYSLAIYAHKTSPTVESQRTLYTVLQSPLPERALNSPQGAIVDASFGPDGKRIVSAGGSGGTAVWDADTGEKLVAFQGDTEAVTSARFSPDGSRIVTAGTDDVARVWDANTGQQLLVLEGHTNDVLSASFSPDGLRIVTSGGEYAWLCDTECDQTARVWDANSGEQLLVLEGHTDRVSSAAFARYEPYIVTASWDKTARVWDAQTGQELARLEGDTRGLTFASFGRSTWLVTASADTTAHVVDFWAVDQIRELAILRGHTDILTSAQFSPDDLQIVTASHDRTARIWETLSGRQLAVLTGHSGVVQSAGFSPDGTRIVTVSAGSALIWRHADRKAEVGRHNLTDLLAGFGDFRLSPDFQYLAATKYDHTVTAWDLATGRRLARLAGHQDRITAMGFSHDGRRLATASKDGTLRLWDVHSGAELVAVSHGHGDEVVSVAFSADDTRLVTASEDNSARVWDA